MIVALSRAWTWYWALRWRWKALIIFVVLVTISAPFQTGDEAEEETLVRSTPAAETPRPTASPSPTAAPTPIPTAKAATYIVQPGDTLNAIAQQFGTTLAALAEANQITDVNRIDVGQSLVIPAPGATGSVQLSPASDCPTTTQQRYFSDAAPAIGSLAVGLAELGVRFGEAGTSPGLLFDDGWRAAVIVALVVLDIAADDLLDLVPTVGTGEIDRLLKSAASDVRRAVELIPLAIDDFDADGLALGALYIARAGEFASEITPLVTNFCN